MLWRRCRGCSPCRTGPFEKVRLCGLQLASETAAGSLRKQGKHTGTLDGLGSPDSTPTEGLDNAFVSRDLALANEFQGSRRSDFRASVKLATRH